MAEADEQKYGLGGIEQAQGYEPMQMANPDPPAEPAMTEAELAHFNRPPPPEPILRDYHDVQTGEPTPDNQVLPSPERAAADLTEARAAERLEVQRAENGELNEALDWLAREEAGMRAALTPVEPAVGEVDQYGRVRTEADASPANDFTPQLDPVDVAALPNQVDPEVLAAFQNPKVRAVLEQVDQGVRQTQAQYEQQLANASLTATASFMAAFSELAGLQPEQFQGAVAYINKTNPARAQEIARQYDRVSHLVVQNQQAQQQQAQQQQALASEQFRQFARASDNRFDAMNKNVSREQMTAIKDEAVIMLKEYGLSDAALAHEYNNNALFRSAAGQQIIADAARYRLAQRAVSRAASRPVPHVIRPGSSAEAQTRTEAALAEAQAKLKPAMSAKEAANYLIARRGANR
jgi:hypothetical protein